MLHKKKKTSLRAFYNQEKKESTVKDHSNKLHLINKQKIFSGSFLYSQCIKSKKSFISCRRVLFEGVSNVISRFNPALMDIKGFTIFFFRWRSVGILYANAGNRNKLSGL